MSNGLVYLQAKTTNKKGTIFFIHGFAVHSSYFINFYNTYLKEYDLYAVELPQMGINSDQLDPLNITSYAEYIKDKIVELNLKNFILVGHSMGGGITGLVCNLIPERIKTAVMICPMNSSFSWKLLNAFKLIHHRNVEDIKTSLRLSYADPIGYFKGAFNRVAQQIYEYKQKNSLAINKLFKSFLCFKTKKALHHSEANNPVKSLVIFCAGDKIIDATNAARKLAKNQNFQIELVDKSGHVPFHENPEKLAYLISEWLK